MSGTCPTMLTVKECANRSGLSYDCIRKLCLENKIVFIYAGAKRLVNWEKFCEYLNGTANRADA